MQLQAAKRRLFSFSLRTGNIYNYFKILVCQPLVSHPFTSSFNHVNSSRCHVSIEMRKVERIYIIRIINFPAKPVCSVNKPAAPSIVFICDHSHRFKSGTVVFTTPAKITSQPLVPQPHLRSAYLICRFKSDALWDFPG